MQRSFKGRFSEVSKPKRTGYLGCAIINIDEGRASKVSHSPFWETENVNVVLREYPMSGMGCVYGLAP